MGLLLPGQGDTHWVRLFRAIQPGLEPSRDWHPQPCGTCSTPCCLTAGIRKKKQQKAPPLCSSLMRAYLAASVPWHWNDILCCGTKAGTMCSFPILDFTTLEQCKSDPREDFGGYGVSTLIALQIHPFISHQIPPEIEHKINQ